jgi:apolipoprotein N-acyltransferase
VVVWPETAVPAFFQRDPQVRPVVLETARQARVDLIFGAPSAENRPQLTPGGEPRVVLFNSAYVVSAEGAVKARYDKQHLVPFGEYVPLSGLLFFVNRLADGIGDFEPGRGMPEVSAGGARVGVLICYEAIFPDLARRVAAGASVLVNITNDAWFGRTAAPWQHLAQAVFRAVELKRPLVRAANTGVSAIVDRSGRVETALGLFTRGTLAARIALPRAGESTLYARVGDRFAHVCALAAAAALVAVGRARRRRPVDAS